MSNYVTADGVHGCCQEDRFANFDIRNAQNTFYGNPTNHTDSHTYGRVAIFKQSKVIRIIKSVEVIGSNGATDEQISYTKDKLREAFSKWTSLASSYKVILHERGCEPINLEIVFTLLFQKIDGVVSHLVVVSNYSPAGDEILQSGVYEGTYQFYINDGLDSIHD